MKKIHFIVKTLWVLFALWLSFVVFIIFLIWKDTWIPYDYGIDASLIPVFEKLELDDGHSFDTLTSLPIRWSTLIDIDGDGVDEIFLWWWSGQNDQIFRYLSWNFIDISEQFNISKWPNENTLAASWVDLDNNWFRDLIVSRDASVIVYYNENGVLTPQEIFTGLDDISSPLWLTFADIDKDWFLDIYLSAYIKKEFIDGLTNFSDGYWASSVLLKQNPDGTFTNITESAGLSYTHNTFQWVFVDLDNDSWVDLVVAHDTWEPRIYQNNWDATFTLKQNPYSGKHSYPMGIAIWDYDNDGFSDIMFSNIGTTLPKTLVKWNLPDTNSLELGWFVFKNTGDFNFIDISDEIWVRDYEFSWGAVFADINNDSKQDLLVAENFVEFTPHEFFPLPGRVLLQNKDGKFVASEKAAKLENKNYWVTPLISDFNEDWALDVVWVNLNGKSYAHIHQNNVSGNFFQVAVNANAQTLWLKAKLTLASGKILTEDFISGEWLAANQSHTIHFWLGEETEIKQLEIIYPNNEAIIREDVKANTKITIN